MESALITDEKKLSVINGAGQARERGGGTPFWGLRILQNKLMKNSKEKFKKTKNKTEPRSEVDELCHLLVLNTLQLVGSRNV